jgi:putative ABC transport system permease protein
LLTQDFGFDPEQLVTLNLHLPRQRYPQESDSRRFFDQLLPRIHALPGVQAAGAVFGLPLSGSIEGQDLELIGAPPLKPGELLTADYAQVSPGYFATMRIPLLYGRDFSERDTANTPLALIVNESFIRQFGLGTNVLGRRLKISDSSQRESEIIGVVRDSKGNGLAPPPRGAMYRSYQQFCRGQMSLVIRTQRDLLDITRAVRAELDNLDKDLPLENVRMMTQLVESSVAERKLSVRLLGGFAGVALLLAAIGLYGVLAYAIAQRTREMGIRTALGAQRGDVIGLVLRQGMKLAGLGVLIGLLGASVLTNFIRSLLYGVGPADPLTFAVIPVLFLGVALLACWLPARRAASVHPMVALRYE